jgi:protein TonB
MVVRDAVAKPDLDVDRVPAPVKQDPPPFKPPYPRGVFGKGGTMEIAIEVMVDTTGKADMSTFKVVKTSHPWFATRLKAAVAKWSFEPAIKAGCKVPRVYKLGISSGTKKSC